MKRPPSVERLRECFTYDPAEGILRWKSSPRNGIAAGAPAGTPSGDGHIQVCFRGNRYLAHCIIWAFVSGEWPSTLLDHENGLKADNRWSNLRLASGSQNQANRQINLNSTTGYKGVGWNAGKEKFEARICHESKKLYLGQFDDPKLAHQAYCDAAVRLKGEFARFG